MNSQKTTWKTLIVLVCVTLLICAGWSQTSEAQDKKLRIAMVVMNLGNGFFEACRDGGFEAAEEIGNIEIIYQCPSTPTAEGQIEIIDALIAQRVDAITISANDKDALVPISKKAMKAGIPVISFDSEIAEAGRVLHLAPSNDEFIGRSQVKMLAEMIDYTGEVSILSASSQSANSNTWIDWMKEELKKPEYKEMELVSVVYGDDMSDKSSREAQGLFKSHPELKGIISPTTVGVASSAKALEDEGLAGKIALTGLGLPSEMKEYVLNGTCEQMALWNPIDLGYAATYMAYQLIQGNAEGAVGEEIPVGKLGTVKVEAGQVAVLGDPFVFDKENIADFAEKF